MRTVGFSWRGLVQHLSLLQADGEAEVLGCIREAVDDLLSVADGCELYLLKAHAPTL